jgi:hypothetical protein
MKRPFLLLPLLALAAVPCLAKDPATNALVGAKAHLMALGAWDEAAFVVAEAKGPAAAEARAEEPAPDPATHARLWLELVDWALSRPSGDGIPSPDRPGDWLKTLLPHIPAEEAWPAVRAGLAERAVAAPGGPPPLLRALIVATDVLAGDLDAARAAFEAGFPEERPGRTQSEKELADRLDGYWRRFRRDAAGFLAGDAERFGRSHETTDRDLAEWRADIEARLAAYAAETNGFRRRRTEERLSALLADACSRDDGAEAARLLALGAGGAGPNAWHRDSFGTNATETALRAMESDEAAGGWFACDLWEKHLRFSVALGRADRSAALFAARLDKAPFATNALARAAAEAAFAEARARLSAPLAEATDPLLRRLEAEAACAEAGVRPPFGRIEVPYYWMEAASLVVDLDEPGVREAVARMLPVCRASLEGRTLGPMIFCTDRSDMLAFVELLRRLGGHDAEVEALLWDSLGADTSRWDPEESIAPILEFYLQAGRPRDVVDFAEGFDRWTRRDLADALDPYISFPYVADALVPALRALGRDAEAGRIAGWADANEYGGFEPLPTVRQPPDPGVRLFWLRDAGYEGEAAHLSARPDFAEAAAAPAADTPPAEDRRTRVGNWRAIFASELRRASAVSPCPVRPVWPAARIPVGDGGAPLAADTEEGRRGRMASDHEKPASIPDRFSPVFVRRAIQNRKLDPSYDGTLQDDLEALVTLASRLPSAETAEPEPRADSAEGAE